MSNNGLVLTQRALEEAPNLKAVFEIDAFRHNWIQNLVKTTGQSEQKAAMNFERERVLFMKKIQENAELEKCNRFTVYSAFIELAASGLTLADDQAYIVPRAGKANFMPGWKGRLEQLALLPQHRDINPPKLVYESDDFDYEEVDGETRIIKHKPNTNRKPGEKILFVYLSIQMEDGRKKIYLMDRETVLNIRDRRSDTYKSYLKACQEAGQDPNEGKPVKRTGRNGEYQMPVPFWVSDEAQAWKKTLVKRVYNETPKTPRMRALDAKIANNFDPETGEVGETHDIDYGIADAPAAQIAPPAPAPAPAAPALKDVAEIAEKMREHRDVELGIAPASTQATLDLGTANPVNDLPPITDF